MYRTALRRVADTLAVALHTAQVGTIDYGRASQLRFLNLSDPDHYPGLQGAKPARFVAFIIQLIAVEEKKTTLNI
jgi:hypothetical protein